MTMLATILDEKKREVSRLYQQPALLAQLGVYPDPPPAQGNWFLDQLTGPGLALIAELKKASPSRGVIRTSFCPETLAKQYCAAGAHALSVLTDEPFFQGALAYMQQARAVSTVPILRKDFIIDPIQLHQAVQYGAHAVLLIAACLTPQIMRQLVAVANQLGLAVLIEVHAESEVMALQGLTGQFAIGVNNRNLTSFVVDLQTAVRLYAPIRQAFPEHPLVAESGYTTGQELQTIANVGYDAVLIGEGLVDETRDMRAWFSNQTIIKANNEN
ncbi:indole-3-glycerol phosphate synthase [bacterium]|jgi:indole-3-glycerol phosphate synthase|nr:indole-3-glycerol phosphate synthase [bacterium]|tara:strand:+ start:2337 stop:3152 length:816 start_codon:yes stop_codon:yes gene_type:complete